MDTPSPITEVSAHPTGAFWVKRDDLLSRLHGGSKLRTRRPGRAWLLGAE